jgi:hypothetical protein
MDVRNGVLFCRTSHVETRQHPFIVDIEPNNADDRALEVVTDVDFGAQTVTKKTIELAPWVELA